MSSSSSQTTDGFSALYAATLVADTRPAESLPADTASPPARLAVGQDNVYQDC
jgi:hypothetical protein